MCFSFWKTYIPGDAAEWHFHATRILVIAHGENVRTQVTLGERLLFSWYCPRRPSLPMLLSARPSLNVVWQPKVKEGLHAILRISQASFFPTNVA